MRTLVTGGAGFIGSHLVDRLLAGGDEVVVLDDFSTGRRENLASAEKSGALRVLAGSAADAELVRAALEGVHRVFHLAAAVGVKSVIEAQVDAIHRNLDTARTVFAACARTGVRVVFASSSEVYGKGERVPFREDDELRLGPTTSARWSYGCAKALAEWLALAYAREQGTALTVARLFNTVGPRQLGHYGMVLPRFVERALAGRPLEVYGDGAQTRCFAAVGDVVEALLALSLAPRALGAVVNVGNDEEIAILDLAHRVREACASPSPVVHLPYDQAYGPGFEDLRRRVPCLRRLEELVGFRPRTDLDGILAGLLGHLGGQASDHRPAARPAAPAR